MRRLTVGPGDGVYPGGVDDQGRLFGVGSYGLQVSDDQGRRLFLTAAHVVGSLSPAYQANRLAVDRIEATTGERPTLPIEVCLRIGPGAAGSGDPTIGQVVASSPEEPVEHVGLDASLVLVTDNVELGTVVREQVCSKRPRELADDGDYVPVFKRGSRTGLTSGLLDPTLLSAVVELAGSEGRTVRYDEGWWVEGDAGVFALPGDSGAIVTDEDDCVIGMVVAVDSENPSDPQPDDPAFVIPIAGLIERLAIELVGPDRPCTMS